MTLDEFIGSIDKKEPLTSVESLIRFERKLCVALPDDYRQFLFDCNGGVFRGRYAYFGPTPEGKKLSTSIHHVGGLREESNFSLLQWREMYQGNGGVRIPASLLWTMDDPFGNAFCLGLTAGYRGRIYFWDHELEPDPDEWDGGVESSGNITLIANSFSDFVASLKPRPKLTDTLQ